jgi:uncharacterized protein YcbX
MSDTVVQLWRYPVKSMQGERQRSLTVLADRIEGDRVRGVFDRETGRLASAKRFSRLLEATGADDHLVLPDGQKVAFADPAASAALSAWLGRDVQLVAAPAAGSLSYEMTFDPPNDDAELVDIPTPAGTLLDLAPVHLLTTATLDHCRARRPDLDWDVRRFRPNLLVDVDAPPFAEDGWAGRRLTVGPVVLSVLMPTVRCAMPLRAQPGGLSRQPELFAAMSDLNGAHPNHLGVYLQVITPGVIAEGDPVMVG